ncbi:MAG TPA: glycosyl transferase, partial [Acidobacteriota bacterium]|nr:glycosyl transferase [Acidobacteriota bacterium]
MSPADTIIAAPTSEKQPIRAEVFGIERLEQHAESLAAAQRVTDSPRRGRDLLHRIRANGQALLAAYRSIIEAVRKKSEITPAEEWILDNFHVVDEQLREIRDHLPRNYYRLLPKVAAGHLQGYPRVYGLAWAYVAHTDSRFSLETLQPFVRAYQRAQPLTIGELWAVTIHLRVALIENLRRISEQIIRGRHARAKADELADRLLGLSGKRTEDADHVLSRLSDAPLLSAFAVQLVQRLRDQDPSIVPALIWLEKRLSAQGTSPTEVVSQEQQAQTAANVTVRNIITSMRWISSIDWLAFFESVSLVDQVLHTCPGFAVMDFKTRNEYRSQIELLSRGSERSEIDVAREAVLLAQSATREREQTIRSIVGWPEGHGFPGTKSKVPGVPDHAPEDPGYYLIARGREILERRLRFRVPLRLRFRREFLAHATTWYGVGIVSLTMLLLSGPLYLSWVAGVNVWVLVLLGILGAVPASDAAVAIVHRLVAFLVPPKLLPKLEFGQGVPLELRTIVVVPTLLTSRAEIEEQLERLEVHYMANPDGQIHFALLTDWTDAPQEHMPGDEDLLAAVADGIAGLNKRCESPPGGGERFLLFHRRRLWNEREGKWIGWERKRGKLHELNRLLRGSKDTSFVSINGQLPAAPPDVRYVITLDADTRLTKEAAYRLVGAMAHPLNRPIFDPRKGRIVEGYAILQPRITPSLPTGPKGTTYQRIISGPGGVDPYAAAVSDVYQDLFEEGSFTGKGVYDVDAFEAALEGRVPENSLLSHDLFEGLFARAGLLTDVDLFEEFPGNYEVAARRLHRWVRGDWQLLPWILNRARDITGARRKTRVPAYSRWKMLDNLRRSLIAPTSFLVLLAAWLLPGVRPIHWIGLAVGSILLPAFIPVIDGLIPHRMGISKRSHLRAVTRDIIVAVSQTLLAITMLAHQAWLMTDAIVRALTRVYITGRHLLEWIAAAQTTYGFSSSLRAFYQHLRWGVFLASGTAVAVALLRPESWVTATPFVVLWALSPVLARQISRPPKVRESHILSLEETRTLRLVARRTWRFFETFVDADKRTLPPDNFQDDPEPVEAHRTSPTNLGLYLQSTVVAHDFGWLGLYDTMERLEATLGTMTDLRRFRGHFMNWYDTQRLQPLDPMYVSTVDSGNLAGHLIALAHACREFINRPMLDAEILEGIRDALQLVVDTMEESGRSMRTGTVTIVQLQEAADAVAALLSDPPASVPEWVRRFRKLESEAEILLDIARTLAGDARNASGPELLIWAGAVRDSIRSHRRDIEASMPWCTRFDPDAAAPGDVQGDDDTGGPDVV